MKTLTNAWLCQFGLIAWKLLILHSFLLGVFSLSAATFTSIHSFNAPIFGDASNDGQGPQAIFTAQQKLAALAGV